MLRIFSDVFSVQITLRKHLKDGRYLYLLKNVLLFLFYTLRTHCELATGEFSHIHVWLGVPSYINYMCVLKCTSSHKGIIDWEGIDSCQS